MICAKVKVVSQKRGKGIAGLKSLRPGPNRVEVGWPDGADGDMAMRAIYNEFGTKGSGKGFKTPRGGGFGGPVPERPFFRTAMRVGMPAFRKVLKAEAKKLIQAAARGEDVGRLKRTALARLGAEAVGQIQDSIDAMNSPPNSELTKKLKGSAKPLIDTGAMKRSATHRVR